VGWLGVAAAGVLTVVVLSFTMDATLPLDWLASIRRHWPSKKAPGSIDRVWCRTSPVTRAVLAKVTVAPFTWPFTEPQMRIDSAEIAP